LRPAEIVQFDQRFEERIIAAYHWDLWAALHIFNEGIAGDDRFEHFRAELIFCGREVFEAALTNADSLADLATLPRGAEGLIYVPLNVYKQQTGTTFPDDRDGPPHPSQPVGQPWQEEDLPQRLPRLWSLYGGEDDDLPEETRSHAVPDEGPRVRVMRGHFENSEGRLIEVDDALDRVIVMLDVFGRPTKVELGKADVELMD
jgi:hypothetical protein